MQINVTLDNVSNRKIKVIFADSCKFDFSINYQLNDSSLVITQGYSYCLMFYTEWKAKPGPSSWTEYEKIRINSSSLTDLPDGYYEVAVGEQYASADPYLENEARASFQILNGSHYFNLSERPTYQVSIDDASFLFSLIFISILFHLFRKKENEL